VQLVDALVAEAKTSSSLLLSSLELSDTTVYEPQLRARLGTTAHFCEVAVLKLAGQENVQLVDALVAEAFPRWKRIFN